MVSYGWRLANPAGPHAGLGSPTAASYQATAVALGALLILGALVSGLAQRSILSLAPLFVLVGFGVGVGGFGWVDFRARSGFVEDLAITALIVILSVTDVGLGFAFGVACGVLASLLMPREDSGGRTDIPAHQRSLYALGVAFATYGVTVLSPHGNGFIAVFVCSIVLGLRRPDLRVHFEERADEIVEIVKLGIFLVFGTLLTFHALGREGWVALALVAIVFFIARPLAVWIALAGTDTDGSTRLFMGWFGPKGVATITFALLVIDRRVSGGGRIFDLAALTVLCSIVLHGLSDTPGAEWIARRSQRAGPGARKSQPASASGTTREPVIEAAEGSAQRPRGGT